jgi:hypothetical protein
MSGTCSLFQNFYQTLLSGYRGSTSTTATGAGDIPITHAYVAYTSGGTEALTIQDGVPGQCVVINHVSDGGAGTLTAATNSTASTWTTIVFADAGDQAILMWVDDTIGWLIVSASGVSAPPAIAVT